MTIDDGGAMQFQEKFNLLVQKILDSYPADFYDSVIDTKNPDSGTIYFKGQTPKGAEELLSSLPGVVVVEGGKVASADVADLVSKLTEVSNKLQFDTGRLHELRFDLSTKQFRVTYLPVNGDGKTIEPLSPEELANIHAEMLKAVAISEPLSLVVDYDPNYKPAFQDCNGGELMQGPAGACTAAFPVKRTNSGQIGVFTAAHCGGGGTVGYTFNNDHPFAANPSGSVYTGTGTGSNGGEFRWLWS